MLLYAKMDCNVGFQENTPKIGPNHRKMAQIAENWPKSPKNGDHYNKLWSQLHSSQSELVVIASASK
jgi:hypothetical protein